MIASHTRVAKLLYPPPPPAQGGGGGVSANGPLRPLTVVDRLGLDAASNGGGGGGGSSIASTPSPQHRSSSGAAPTSNPPPQQQQHPPQDAERDANKYRQFRLVEDHVTSSLRSLISSTSEDSLAGTNMTMMAGALSLALTYIHKLAMPVEGTTLSGTLQAGGGVAQADGAGGGAGKKDESEMSMNARILVVSVSGDLAEQYIPIMNCIFAAQRKVGASDSIKFFLWRILPSN